MKIIMLALFALALAGCASQQSAPNQTVTTNPKYQCAPIGTRVCR